MFVRRYRSRREELEWLEDYLEELKAEVEGVEERIEELKEKQQG